MNLYSSVLGEVNAIFCCDENDLIEETTDFSTCSFLYDIDVLYSHIIDDVIDIDIVNFDFPINVSKKTSQNKNVQFSIDKKSENGIDFLEINTLNINDFENGALVSPGFIINVITNDKESQAIEIESGKYQFELKNGIEQISLKIHEYNFHKYFSGEVK